MKLKGLLAGRKTCNKAGICISRCAGMGVYYVHEFAYVGKITNGLGFVANTTIDVAIIGWAQALGFNFLGGN